MDQEWRYAGFMARLVAYLLDVIVIYLGQWVIAAAVAFLMAANLTVMGVPAVSPYDTVGYGGTDAAVAMGVLVASLLSLIYFPIFEGIARATPGKILMGIVVVDRVTGRPIGFGRALLRALGKLVNALPLGLPWLMVAFREDRRGLHDLMAGSVVVHRSSLTPLD